MDIYMQSVYRNYLGGGRYLFAILKGIEQHAARGSTAAHETI